VFGKIFSIQIWGLFMVWEKFELKKLLAVENRSAQTVGGRIKFEGAIIVC
jgi:hypothetical protein